MQKEVNKSIKQGNISLILDNYDDIFSDFDPRNYSERALSDDFLNECRKAARDKDLELELRFLLPKVKRNLNDELKIKKRLKDHFLKHYKEKQIEIKKVKEEGLVWFIIGALIAFSATFLYDNKSFLSKFLIIVAEPAGWFTMWNGLDKIFSEIKRLNPELNFYKKMSNAQFYFLDF